MCTCMCIYVYTVCIHTHTVIVWNSVQRQCFTFLQGRKASLAFRELKVTKETKVSLELKVREFGH